MIDNLAFITHMWPSCVEIEGYSVAYLNYIAAFKVPYCWTSVKGGAHMRFIAAWISNKSAKCIWAPPLTEVQRYSASKAADRNMRWNNLWFLHGTATHAFISSMHVVDTSISDASTSVYESCPKQCSLVQALWLVWCKQNMQRRISFYLSLHVFIKLYK